MGNFWTNKLAQAAPAQQQAPALPPIPGGPWWQQPQSQPQAVAPVVTQHPAQVEYGSGTPPAGQSHIGDLLRQENYHTTKAQSVKDAEPCPNCQSPNYVSAQGHPNAMKSCFDCGFNPRFEQSMAGISGIGQNLPQKEARVQTTAPPPGFGPMNTIIQKIS